MNWKSNLFHFSLILLFIGVCCSKFLMSMGLLTGGIYFFFTGGLKEKLYSLWKNHFFLLILGFYAMHILGLLWSDNISMGLNDIRQKSSMLIIPIIVFSSPYFTQKSLNIIKVIFIASLLVTSLINFIGFHLFFNELELKEIRNMSLFIGHIRYALVISLGASWCFYEYLNQSKFKTSFLLVFLWLVFYTLESQVLSGIVAVLLGVAAILIWKWIELRRWKALIGFSFFSLLLIGSTAYYLSLPIQNPEKTIELNALTQEAWRKKSSIALNDLDKKGNEIIYTLNRYLYSKEYPLDEYGIEKLSSQDVMNIENGIADLRLTQWAPIARLFEIRYEIHVETNPNLHPIIERFELWNNAYYTVEKNWLFGVGNGNIQEHLNESYIERNSILTKERQLRPHNTFLTYWLTYGILGLAFVSFLLYFGFRTALKKNIQMGLVFILILASSFIYEDTLESQAGITFFALFYALFGKIVSLKDTHKP